MEILNELSQYNTANKLNEGGTQSNNSSITKQSADRNTNKPAFTPGTTLDLISKVVTFEDEPITESVADSSFISNIDFKSKIKALNLE